MVISILDDGIVLYRLHGIQPDQIYHQARLHAPKPFCLRIRQNQNYIRGIVPVPVGLITEICGPASSGKTQACLSFAIDSFMSTSRKILYFDTENNFSIDRLIQILSARFLGHSMSDEYLTQLANSVIVINEFAPDGLLERLRNLDELIVSEKISSLILDSIAATCRCNSLTDSKKHEYLAECASQLKYLADKYALSCLVTNQVVGNYERSVTNTSASSLVRPALGLTWSHSVNVRYMLEPALSQGSGILRVHKSPLAMFTVQYKITEAGLIPDYSETEDN